MKVSQGWLRLWLVATLLIISFSFIGALTARDIYRETSGSMFCVPGTTEWTSEQREDGIVEPTKAEAKRAYAEAARAMPDASEEEKQLAAGINATKTKYKEVTLFSCTSYLGVVRAVLVALLVSLAPALMYLAARWVWRGFRENNKSA